MAFADEENASVILSVLDSNDDLTDPWGLSVQIRQVGDPTSGEPITPATNPFVIDSLVAGETYWIDVYRHNMIGDSFQLKVTESVTKETAKIPTLAGVVFEVLYGNRLPVEGASVEIFSHDGIKWSKSVTDDRGKTERIWLQETIESSDYYSANVVLHDSFVYQVEKFTLHKGYNDKLVVTPWSTTVDGLVTFKLYDSPTSEVDHNEGYTLELYDDEFNKIHSSQVDYHGEVKLSGLHMGNYFLKVLKQSDDPLQELDDPLQELDDPLQELDDPLQEHDLWAFEKLQISNEQTLFKIFEFGSATASTESSISTLEHFSSPSSCNCVSFRLDGVQDKYLNRVQANILKLFETTNEAITVGVIGENFGSDDGLIKFLRKSLENNPKIEIGNQATDKDLTAMNHDQQEKLIQTTNQVIFDKLGTHPSVFIPPFGKYDGNTRMILENEEMNIISSISSLDPGPYASVDDSGLHIFDDSIIRLPATASTSSIEPGKDWHGKTAEQVIQDVEFSLRDYGFAVIQLHPQEFSKRIGWTFHNEPDMQQIIELSVLIEKINEKGLKIVPLGKIPSEFKLKSGELIPAWMKNNAKWWSQNNISNLEFKNSLEYLVHNNIILITDLESEQSDQRLDTIEWIKTNAGSWANGEISDQQFLNKVAFMIQ